MHDTPGGTALPPPPPTGARAPAQAFFDLERRGTMVLATQFSSARLRVAAAGR